MASTSASGSDPDGITTPNSPIAVDPNAITTSSLKALQSDDQRKVMDIVDSLRRNGLNGVVGLPQLVVCGDQSSGKSSVLEAITEIPFPRKENLCTRFATEIILRRSQSSTISITITPDKNRPKEQVARLKSFTKTINDFSQLPEVIEEATDVMGLGKVGENNSRAFARDTLSVEICGPDRPQLTVVDLPGLIHATNKAQTEADKELILDLVKEYMKNPRTIILAVVSAKNDFANQIILDHCKKIDEKRERTLGIVTKPDYLREGSQNEIDWIELAQNKNIYFKLGWHMLKNRADDEMDFTFAQRNEAEAMFFNKGRYTDLPRECVGIDSLRERLSKLLLNHLVKELPSLREEMITKLDSTRTEIEKLGEKRTTIADQRMLLMKVSTEMNNILTAAVNGHYKNSFFGSIDMEAPVDSTTNIRRFRAVIQHLNLQFAQNMQLRGHLFRVTNEETSDREENDDQNAETIDRRFTSHMRIGLGYESADESRFGEESDDGLNLPVPKSWSHDEALAWVKKVMERSRGHELPGTFNPDLINQIFWEQSRPWKEIANLHIDNVFWACKKFVLQVLEHSAPTELCDRLKSLTVLSTLNDALKTGRAQLARILKDNEGYPMTYNHYFTDTIQASRREKYKALTENATEAATSHNYAQRVATLDTEKFREQMASSIEQNMDKFASEEALTSARAYYKEHMKYFIKVVTTQVIERHLVEPIADTILSPLIVAGMSDREVTYIAAEPSETSHERAHLEQRQNMLEKGLETFREAMGEFKRR